LWAIFTRLRLMKILTHTREISRHIPLWLNCVLSIIYHTMASLHS
jgi:hypothetical protein